MTTSQNTAARAVEAAKTGTCARLLAEVQADADAGGEPRRGSGEWPFAFDPVIYDRRKGVERALNRLKQWCGLATRYDGHAQHDHAGLLPASTFLCLGS